MCNPVGIGGNGAGGDAARCAKRAARDTINANSHGGQGDFYVLHVTHLPQLRLCGIITNRQTERPPQRALSANSNAVKASHRAQRGL